MVQANQAKQMAGWARPIAVSTAASSTISKTVRPAPGRPWPKSMKPRASAIGSRARARKYG